MDDARQRSKPTQTGKDLIHGAARMQNYRQLTVARDTELLVKKPLLLDGIKVLDIKIQPALANGDGIRVAVDPRIQRLNVLYPLEGKYMG